MSQTTHCIMCHKEMTYPEETFFDERPRFCSNRCSKRYVRMYDDIELEENDLCLGSGY